VAKFLQHDTFILSPFHNFSYPTFLFLHYVRQFHIKKIRDQVCHMKYTSSYTTLLVKEGDLQ